MKITRVWAMPSAETFSIPPIQQLLRWRLKDCTVVIDPFARNNRFGTITNDLNPETGAKYHMEAGAFLAVLEAERVVADAALFDPPYSLGEVHKSYQDYGIKGEDNPTGGYPMVRDALSRLVKVGGIVISFGWNTVGMSGSRHFDLEEILLVCHGGNRNDTIVTVERKVQAELRL